jgi:hypothetical protein
MALLPPIPDGFVSVSLCTNEGRFVTGAYIPNFQPLPDVLVWGQRIFRHDKTVLGSREYREAFAFMVMPGFADIDRTQSG